MKTKNYITQAYIDMLKNKEKQTGLYYATPKVIVKGDRYRKALNPTEKLLYQELWDLSMKAAHKGQYDEKGRVYVKTSYSFLATAIGVDVSTIDRTINKRKTLFLVGLLSFKKKGNKTEHEYYVMAPIYEGADEQLLYTDKATWNMQKEVQQFADRKNSNRSNKHQSENEQLENERENDLPIDYAEYEMRNCQDYPDVDESTESAGVSKVDYETLMKKIQTLGIKYHKQGRRVELTAIVEKYFGVGGLITEATEDDLPNMQLAYDEMQSTARELKLYLNVKKVVKYVN